MKVKNKIKGNAHFLKRNSFDESKKDFIVFPQKNLVAHYF